MKLGDMIPGQTGIVVGYSGADRAYRQKLLQMGLVRGTPFKLLRKAPMGDPIEIELNGFKLTLRKEEAEVLEAETGSLRMGKEART
ncbi:MAG: FeoA family protein [Kiritimatiellae bacterium]|jgi:ferrous iron transport protein A|nr:FeoA family protein [Kiritimatiellia bacterium]